MTARRTTETSATSAPTWPTALATLTRVEAKLMLRDPGTIITLAIPMFIMLVFASSTPPGDTTIITMAVAVSIGLVGLYMVPTALAGYRERGVLRRMSATPVHPAMLLTVQLVLHLCYAAVSLAVLAGTAIAVFGTVVPAGVAPLLAAVLLGATSVFSIGLVIAALASDARVANGVGVLLYFPLAYLGGIMAPPESMPAFAAGVGAFTPLGALRGAVLDAWAGEPTSVGPLAIMAGYTVVLVLIAARTFRWG